MKLTAIIQDNRSIVAAVEPEGLRPLAEMEVFWRDPVAGMAQPHGELIPPSEVRQIPAVPRTAQVICVGLNYRRHAEEAGLPTPPIPVIFSRWARTLAADGDPAPVIEDKFDWEGELGVVIGRRMFRVNAAQGLEGVFGYVAFNDLSGRTFQTQTPQFTMGKNSDSSGPMSVITTRDAVGDPAQGLRLTTRVNDELKQDSTTADMIFSIGEIIAFVTQVMTLEPGDLIVTGTPAGVGMATGQFLKPGDVVEVEIEGVGKVGTPIVSPGSGAPGA